MLLKFFVVNTKDGIPEITGVLLEVLVVQTVNVSLVLQKDHPTMFNSFR